MQNLENLDNFEILITQKLLKCLKDPFLRSALVYIASPLVQYNRCSAFMTIMFPRFVFQGNNLRSTCIVTIYEDLQGGRTLNEPYPCTRG